MDYRQTLQVGTVLDRKYRIERILGSGGFGITYEAFDLALAAPVAIKEYFPSQFGIRDTTYSVRPRSESDRDMFERLRASFLREARTLNQFDHPAIVRVLNVFEAYGTAYMVMRYETGPSLKSWLAKLGRQPTQAELDRLVAPLLDALEAMHSAAFLHRDIAPDNIIVRADGSPVLLDFGASRRVMGEMSGTLTGVVKKGYSPQEQYATDGRSQGPWTDIYALGATLYRCVSGEIPEEATQRVLDDRVVSAVNAAAGDYRHGFLSAIDAAIVVRPEARPQSISLWRKMLFEDVSAPRQQLVVGPEDTAATRGVEGSSAPLTSPTDTRTGTSVPGRERAPEAASARRFPLSKGAMALAACAVAVVGGIMVFAQDRLVTATVQPPTSSDVSPSASGSQSARQAQEPRSGIASQEAADRVAEELRQKREDESRQRRADAAKRRAEDDARQRLLAAEVETRRRQEEAQRRALEEAERRAAEEARLRKLAEDAEAARRAAEEAQRRQGEQIARLTQEAAQRAAEEARRRAEEDARQRKVAEETEASRRAAEEAQRRQEEQIARLTREAAQRAAEETRRQFEEEVRQKKLVEEAAKQAAASVPEANARNVGFDGAWILQFKRAAAVCPLESGEFKIVISAEQVTIPTKKGPRSGKIGASGNASWTLPSPRGPHLVDWTGTFKGDTGSGRYVVRNGRCHGTFTARRG